MITVVVTASPIPSNPDTAILDETLDSLRHHLPNTPIWVLFDGVRDEQKHMREAYEQHQALAARGDVKFWRFPKHLHQVGMLRQVIDHIDTPLLLFIEQDTPLLTDRVIDWDLISEWLLSGRSNCVRLYHEEVIPESHRYLFMGQESDAPLIRTAQWSARPHVATVTKYRQWLNAFSPNANTYLEDLLHSVVQENVKHHGWETEKVHLYAPTNDQGYRRSGHLDGRAGAPKFEAELRF